MCELFLAPVSNPPLTLTSWLALLSPFIGEKFNDIPKVIEIISADQDLNPSFPAPRADVHVITVLELLDLTYVQGFWN